MDIGTIWHCALVSCTPSQSMWLVLGYVGGLFTVILIECYFIMIFIMIVGNIIGIFYGHSLLFELSSSGSANAQLPGCFRPWTFFLNIGLNMLPSGSFMSGLHSLLGMFYRGVPGFATDCPCGVWCRGLTTCLLHVGQLVLNGSRFAIME